MCPGKRAGFPDVMRPPFAPECLEWRRERVVREKGDQQVSLILCVMGFGKEEGKGMEC